MDYMVQGILQARILEWVAFPFSRGSSQPRDQTQVFHTAGTFFISWATREAQVRHKQSHILLFHLCELSKISKSTETKNRLVIASNWGKGGKRIDCQRAWDIFLWWWEYSRVRLWWWLHNLVNILEITELYTLKW